MVKSYCLAGLSMQFRACLLRTSSLTVLEGHGSFKHHCIHCSKIPQAHKACISNLVQVPERAVHWGTVHMLVLGHGEKHSEEGIGTHTNNSQCDYSMGRSILKKA